MGKQRPYNVFAVLRDGYEATVRQFFQALRSELQGMGSRRPPTVAWMAQRINEAVPPWLQDTGARLERDLTKATREVLADTLGEKELAEERLQQFAAQRQLGGPELRVPTLQIPPPRALREGLRQGSGTALALWLLTLLLVSEPWRNAAYGASVVLGFAVGFYRFRRVFARETQQQRRLLDEHLQRAALQVVSAIEAYIAAWVQEFTAWSKQAGEEG